MSVGDEVWTKIENKLNKQPRKVVLWPWLSGITAAAIAIFILLFSVNNQNDTTYETANLLSDVETTTKEVVPENQFTEPVAQSVVKTEKPLVAEKTKQTASEHHRPENYVNTEKSVSGQEIEQPQKTTVSTSESKTEQPAIAEKTNSGEQTKKNFVLPDPNPDFNDDDYVVPVKKQKNKLSLLASLGSKNDYLAIDNNNMVLSSKDMFQSSPMAPEDPSKNDVLGAMNSRTAEVLEIENFPDAIHLPPVSVGIMFNKALNHTSSVSIESGVVYTLLRSEFENKQEDKKAGLNLHYIGIPLNLQMRIFGNKFSKWEIYLSAGGMIEKGIYSHYKQDNQINNSITHIVSNEKIDGFQYSLSFAPGVNYKLSPKYGIFLEPKFSYYFDNDQPVSSRTEHPVVIGVNAGLRLCW
jgi:hypothetical protein